MLDGNSEKFREKGSEYKEPIDSEKEKRSEQEGCCSRTKDGEQRLNRGNVSGKRQGAMTFKSQRAKLLSNANPSQRFSSI